MREGDSGNGFVLRTLRSRGLCNEGGKKERGDSEDVDDGRLAGDCALISEDGILA